MVKRERERGNHNKGTGIRSRIFFVCVVGYVLKTAELSQWNELLPPVGTLRRGSNTVSGIRREEPNYWCQHTPLNKLPLYFSLMPCYPEISKIALC